MPSSAPWSHFFNFFFPGGGNLFFLPPNYSYITPTKCTRLDTWAERFGNGMSKNPVCWQKIPVLGSPRLDPNHSDETQEKLKTGTSACGLSTRTSLPEHRTDVTRLLHEYHSYSETIWLLVYFLSSANSFVVETITIIKRFYIKNALWDNWWGFTLSSQAKFIFSTKRLACFSPYWGKFKLLKNRFLVSFLLEKHPSSVPFSSHLTKLPLLQSQRHPKYVLN